MTTPFTPISETTQASVDRLVGSQVGGVDVLGRFAEGRLSTLYDAWQRATGRAVTLEVLRTGIEDRVVDARAVVALKCPGIADVLDFGALPDGRRYRVLERLEGVSLEESLLDRGTRSPIEVAQLLGRVTEVVQTLHAWTLPHGNVRASSVFVNGERVKLIDFSLANQPASLEADLSALGALGLVLLTGDEQAAPPPAGSVPQALEQLLSDLRSHRVKDATAARRAFARTSSLLAGESASASSPVVDEAPSAPVAAPPRRRVGLVMAGVVVTALAGAGVVMALRGPSLGAEDDDALTLDEALVELEPLPTVDVPADPTRPAPVRPRPVKRTASIPSAAALMAEITRLESKFLTRPRGDAEQAMYVLNKQRLRLTGTPTERDRKDVARQLAAWRRSYLVR